MNTPPPPDDLPQELIQAYRRASADDRSKPSQRVRDTILARARQAAASSANTRDPLIPATAAANDARWKWKTAAGLATVGLVGLLALQNFHTSTRMTTATDSSTVETPSRPLQTPSETDLAAPSPPPAAAPAVRAQASSRPEAADRLSPPAPAATAAATEKAATHMSVASAAAPLPAPSWHDKAVAAVRATYPDLFSAPDISGTAQIAPC